MKKITRIFSAALAVASMAACTQGFDESNENVTLGGNEFAAQAEASTKVTIDANWKLSWEAGDQVDIFDGESTNVFSAKTAGASTTLAADDKDFTKESGKTYYAVYPSGANEFAGSEVTLTVAGDRKAEAGVYPSAPAVGVTTGSESSFAFKNVCGLVSFEIAEAQNIASIVIFGGNGENIAGSVKVNALTAEHEITKGETEITLTPADGDVFAAGRYYVAVLPQEFTSGMSVTLYKNDGTRLRKNLKAFTLGRSTHIDVETGGEFKTQFTIKNADELAAFMAVADKCAVGTVATLANDIDLAGVTLPEVSSFAGTFDGNGKSLKNWTTDKPLFTKIVAGATVTGVVLDASCTLKMKETTSRQAFVVGENEGTVSGCTNKANITYTRATDTPMLSRVFGTIVGFSKGLVENCHNEGNITITIPMLDYPTGATYQHQRVGGVIGGFNVQSGVVGVTGCTNKGNITYNFKGVTSSSENPHKAYRPHFAIGGVCAVVANNGTPKKASEAVNNGTIENCSNSGEIKLYQEGISGSNYSNVGGVVGYLEGTISSCANEETGKVTLQLKNSSAVKVSAPAVGGVVGTVTAGEIKNCINGGDVFMTGYVQEGSNDAAYAGGIKTPSIGGIVAKAGSTVENTALKISDCKNSGKVSVEVWNSNHLRMGGIVGWTSIPVAGSSANKLQNTGELVVKTSSTFKTAYIGGVIGESISTFDKAYNTAAVTMANKSTTATEQKVYVGGIAGYMAKTAAATFQQGNNTGAINVSGGKSDGKEGYNVGGVVGMANATSVNSKNTSWAESNSNYGDITVNCPVKVCVGGVVAKAGNSSTASKSTLFQKCKNRGDITVTSPLGGSFVGGVFGHVTRGALGDANNCGVADDPVQITVTGATADTYVGGYIGEKENNHGHGVTEDNPNAGLWTMRLSGVGMYVSISAPGATAGLVAGNLQFTGNSSSNIVMLGGAASSRPKFAKDCKLNDKVVGDLTSTDIKESDFFGKVTPSASSTVIGPDNESMASRYMFFAAGGSASVSYKDGLQNY